MISGVAKESRWITPEPRRQLPLPLIQQIVVPAFPDAKVIRAEPFADGVRNANFRLQLDRAPNFVVLRIYEHDPSICQKEIDLHRHLRSLSVQHPVPIRGLLHAEEHGRDGLPPYTLWQYVEAINFGDLKRRGDRLSISQAAFAIGQTLATIGRVSFRAAGWLGPGPKVTGPLLQGADPLPQFIELCLAAPNLRQRADSGLRDRLCGLTWKHARQLATLDGECHLVHGDFGKRNQLLHPAENRWKVAAVLDWEFAVSGSPLIDIGHFLRYERAAQPLLEPHFSAGYLAGGGKLGPDWRRLARLVDLAALCESLTHDFLPDDVTLELVELARATVEDRDPVLP